MPVIANIRVGKPQVSPSISAHTEGMREGNQSGNFARDPGHLPSGAFTARRSTGINPDARNPIDARMPALSPA